MINNLAGSRCQHDRMHTDQRSSMPIRWPSDACGYSQRFLAIRTR
jgi:hypothetical protein